MTTTELVIRPAIDPGQLVQTEEVVTVPGTSEQANIFNFVSVYKCPRVKQERPHACTRDCHIVQIDKDLFGCADSGIIHRCGRTLNNCMDACIGNTGHHVRVCSRGRCTRVYLDSDSQYCCLLSKRAVAPYVDQTLYGSKPDTLRVFDYEGIPQLRPSPVDIDRPGTPKREREMKGENARGVQSPKRFRASSRRTLSRSLSNVSRQTPSRSSTTPSSSRTTPELHGRSMNTLLGKPIEPSYAITQRSSARGKARGRRQAARIHSRARSEPAVHNGDIEMLLFPNPTRQHNMPPPATKPTSTGKTVLYNPTDRDAEDKARNKIRTLVRMLCNNEHRRRINFNASVRDMQVLQKLSKKQVAAGDEGDLHEILHEFEEVSKDRTMIMECDPGVIEDMLPTWEDRTVAAMIMLNTLSQKYPVVRNGSPFPVEVFALTFLYMMADDINDPGYGEILFSQDPSLALVLPPDNKLGSFPLMEEFGKSIADNTASRMTTCRKDIQAVLRASHSHNPSKLDERLLDTYIPQLTMSLADTQGDLVMAPKKASEAEARSDDASKMAIIPRPSDSPLAFLIGSAHSFASLSARARGDKPRPIPIDTSYRSTESFSCDTPMSEAASRPPSTTNSEISLDGSGEALETPTMRSRIELLTQGLEDQTVDAWGE